MPAGLVMSGPALARGLRADFINTWRKRYELNRARLTNMMELGIKADQFVSIFGYGETPIYPARVPWGEAPRREPHLYRTFEVEQFRWMAEVIWLKRDRELSQLRSIQADAAKAALNWGTLAERIFFQFITAGTDVNLHSAVPTAPDGAAMFAALDGDSADRFGISGGNIVSGHLWTTGEGVRSGFFAAIEQIGQFQDPRGQPFMDDGVMQEGVTYIYPIARRHEVSLGFLQQFTAIAASTATSNAAVSNVVLDSGMKVVLYGTNRYTTDQGFLFVNSMDAKPVFELISAPLSERYYDEGNSYDHGQRGHESLSYEMWGGHGVNLPNGACKITT